MRLYSEGPTFRELISKGMPTPERVRADQIETLRGKHGNLDLQVTAEGWWSPVPIKGERHICDPYFYFNRIDPDPADTSGTKDADLMMENLHDAGKLVEWLSMKFGIPASLFPIFYSGDRAFHVCLDPEPVGMEPSFLNRGVVRHFGMQIADFLGLSTFDPSVYSETRNFLRLVDSVNSKTGRYSVQVTLEEAQRGSYEEIIKLSEGPRGQVYDQAKQDLDDQALKTYYSLVQRRFEKLDTLGKLRPLRPISGGTVAPGCIDSILFPRSTNSMISERTTGSIMAFASFNKDAGLSLEESVDETLKWTGVNDGMGDDYKAMKSIVVSVTTEVFSSERYHFSCHFMKSLSNDPDFGLPLCDDETCERVNSEDQEVAYPPEVELDKAVDPPWSGQRIQVQAAISGFSYDPYKVPRTIHIKCSPLDSEKCAACIMNQNDHDLRREIPPRDEVLLRMIDVSEKRVRGALLDWIGISTSCTFAKVSILNEFSVYELNLVPVIRVSPELLVKDKPFVSRIAVLIDPSGQGRARLEKAREFNLVVYPHKDPSTQKNILQIVDSWPMEDYIDDFKMTGELHKDLQVFQPAPGQDLWAKWLEIENDLAANVLGIYGRADMFFTLDLVYFSSTRGFFLEAKPIEKGHCEALLVGDTGEGKTTMAKRLIAHYGFGLFCSGETARRTGLLYTLVQPRGKEWFIVWGILPMCDKGLVVIDEFTGLEDKDKETLTAVRSSGLVEVSGAASGKAQARTRIVFMCNSPDGRPMKDHNFGCETVMKVFKKPEDVRRLDIANTVANGEVLRGDLDRCEMAQVKPEHMFTAALCNRLLMWAWSRKPEQIEFTEEAVRAVYEARSQLDEKYVQDIPLLQMTDLKNKIARGAVALAARFFSTRDGEVLTVGVEHVRLYVKLIDSIYGKRSFGFLAKSKSIKKAQEATKRNVINVKNMMEEMFPAAEDLTSFCQAMLNTNTFARRDVQEMVPFAKDKFESFFQKLHRTGMVQRRGQSWVKSDYFKDLLKFIQDNVEWAEQDERPESEQADLF